jgi:predicted DNA-binding antitoxin AbrB/MazE fold protein
MKETLAAIYENGVFRPLKSPRIADGEQVRLIVESPEKGSPEDMIKLATDVYQGLSEEEIDAIERIALNRASFFGKPTP